ncbi:DUF7453 family protein [Mucisphaera calidilacus]|uniref:PEP-CTERM sorting domain-containing protein n=1 Tax=Mucisphaera calidilacus TaxID=2527982 RepID=A0A518BYL1_9BACT|nr:hypothetical protein [Mucisphaera calidilacus]QDU72061.1 hypothetical protein Pan265_19230 [Mucisphaera calidilacus]
MKALSATFCLLSLALTTTARAQLTNILSVGDPLDEGVSFNFVAEYDGVQINNANQIAFFADVTFSDDTFSNRAIYRAEPDGTFTPLALQNQTVFENTTLQNFFDHYWPNYGFVFNDLGQAAFTADLLVEEDDNFDWQYSLLVSDDASNIQRVAYTG